MVPAKVYLSLKTPATRCTGERFEASVFPAVRDEVGGLAEGFAAVVTFVRLLSYIKRRNRSR